MPSFTVVPNGQTVVLSAVTGLVSGTPTVYTSSAYSSSVTIPTVLNSTTSYYFRELGAKVTITQPDGSALISAQPIQDGDTLAPMPTVAQLAADVSIGIPSPAGFLLNGSPATPVRETVSRTLITSNMSALTTAVMHSTAIYLNAGDVVTNLTFTSGATAAGTPANWWFALYDNSTTPALLSQSADQTSTAWAANTSKTLALTAPQTITTAGIYYASIMVKASTPPTLAGVTLENAAVAGACVTGQKILAQTSGSALTATAPGTIASATTVATVAYVIAN